MGKRKCLVTSLNLDSKSPVRIDPDMISYDKVGAGVVSILTGQTPIHLKQWLYSKATTQSIPTPSLHVENLCDYMLECLQPETWLHVVMCPGTGIAVSYLPSGMEGMLVFTLKAFAEIHGGIQAQANVEKKLQ